MPETTREEHLAWCKRRALQYVEAGQLQDAVASMTSDLRKHPETGRPGVEMLGLLGLGEIRRGPDAVREWIEGFR